MTLDSNCFFLYFSQDDFLQILELKLFKSKQNAWLKSQRQISERLLQNYYFQDITHAFLSVYTTPPSL